MTAVGSDSLCEERSDGLAGTAPGGEAVEHDNLVLLEGCLPGVNAEEGERVRVSGRFSLKHVRSVQK